MRGRSSRGRVAVVAFLLALAHPLVASADPDKKACLAAVDEGQNLRDQGKLTDAKAQFLVCASKSCPALVGKQCSDWYAEVEKDQPTVLFRAKDASGKEVVDVKVIVDGKAILEAISSQPLSLEPTEHAIRFEGKGGLVAMDRVVLRVGEKARVIELAFPVATPKAGGAGGASSDPRASGFRIPLLGWVGGGLFVAGAATTVVFAVMASGDEQDLRSTCAPGCAADDRDAIETKLLVANVGMFVGLAGLAVAGVTTLLANRSPSHTAARPPSGLRVVATPGGIAGTF